MADEPAAAAQSRTILADKYEVGRMIGRGGLAAVHEGRHIQLGRVVAIKLIDPQLLENDEVVTRFRQEARATSAVQSDHIVQVFDVGQDPRVGMFMVMEQLVGEDLEGVIAKKGALPVADAVDIACQVARGLSRAHAAGIVHRDLKPANVFLTTRDDGSTLAKILDFGISKLLRPGPPRSSLPPPGEASVHGEINLDRIDKGITRYGTALGTPQYMSPEQAQGLAVDRRTDVWSLGAVLFEMLSGVPAFEEKTKFEDTVAAIVERPAPSLRDFAAEIPAPLADVVAHALERDVKKRIPDCETFARLLIEATEVRGDAPTLEAPALVLEPDTKPADVDASQIVDLLDLAPAHDRDVTPEPTVDDTQKRTSPKRRRSVRAIAFGVLALVTLGVAGAWMARDGKTKADSAPAAPAPTPSPSPSVSASAKPATKPKPWKPPPKPKTKSSASTSAGAGKGFGAAGVATSY